MSGLLAVSLLVLVAAVSAVSPPHIVEVYGKGHKDCYKVAYTMHQCYKEDWYSTLR